MNNFYEKILKSLSIDIDNGFLKMNGDICTVKGTPLAMATNDNARGEFIPDGNKLKRVRHLFNPMSEFVGKSDNISLLFIKSVIETLLTVKVQTIGTLLLTVAKETSTQAKLGLEISRFLSDISEFKRGPKAEVVDDQTIQRWLELFANYITTADMFNVVIMKGTIIDNVRYNRVSNLKCSLLEDLNKIIGEEKPIIRGVKLRVKDINIFKYLLNYIIIGFNSDNNLLVGSDDDFAPAFVSLLTMYHNIVNRMNELSELVKFVSNELSDLVTTKLEFSLDDLKDVKRYSKEVQQFTGELEPAKQPKQQVQQIQTVQPCAQQQVVQQPYVQQQVVQQPYVQQQVVQQPYVQQPYVQQQVVQQPYGQQPYGQQVVQQPYGQQDDATKRFLSTARNMRISRQNINGYVQPTAGGYQNAWQQQNVGYVQPTIGGYQNAWQQQNVGYVQPTTGGRQNSFTGYQNGMIYPFK